MRAIICALCLFCSAALADEAADGPPRGLSHHGFVSYTATDVTKYSAGLGLDYRGDVFDVYALFTTAKDGSYSLSGARYFYVERQERISGAAAAGLRIGRVRHMLGFNNLKRENPHDSDYIWHPPAIYREHAAHIATSGDGGQVYLKASPFEWDTTVQLTHVRPVMDPMQETVAVIFGDPRVGSFTGGSRITGVNLTTATPDHTLQFRYDFTRLSLDFKPSAAMPFLASGNTDTQLHTIGMRAYVTDDLDLTVERIMVRNRGQAVWDAFHAVWPVEGNPGGHAVTIRWRPVDRLQFTATVDKWCTDESDCSGSRGAQFGIPAHAFYSKSKILSVRYNFDQNWSAMLQIMRTEGSNTELATEEKRAVTDRVGLRISYSW